MKHIRRKITVAVLGTMLLVFAVLLAAVNLFIPSYLTSEAQRAILAEDARRDPIPLAPVPGREDCASPPALTKPPFG